MTERMHSTGPAEQADQHDQQHANRDGNKQPSDQSVVRSGVRRPSCTPRLSAIFPMRLVKEPRHRFARHDKIAVAAIHLAGREDFETGGLDRGSKLGMSVHPVHAIPLRLGDEPILPRDDTRSIIELKRAP